MPTPDPHRSTRSRFGRPAAAFVAAAAAGGVGLYLRNPSQRLDVRTDVKIAASPDEVWRTLVDFAAYPDWNPFLVEMHGDPTEGAPLTGVSRLSGGRRFGFNSTVTRAEVGRHLAWSGGSRRLLWGRHWLALEPVDGGAATVVSHGEEWRGLLIPLLSPFGLGEHSYVAMNEALRRRVEG